MECRVQTFNSRLSKIQMALFGALFFFPISLFAQTVTSTESVTITATVGTGAPSGTTSGSHESNSPAAPAPAPIVEDLTSSITVKGLAYPGAKVTILVDNQEATTTIAASDATFSVKIGDIVSGVHNISVYAVDGEGHRSTLQTYTIKFTDRAQVSVANIFLPPTLTLSSTELAPGVDLSLRGVSVPKSAVSILIDGIKIIDLIADEKGVFGTTFKTANFTSGTHTIKAVSKINAASVSEYGTLYTFTVNAVEEELPIACPNGDNNCDNKVDVSDFSIMAFWFQKPNPPKEIDLNSDGKVSIEDFSILAYYWSN